MATYAGKLKVGGTELPIGSTLYGTCDTAAGTAAKVVTMANFDTLITGVTIHVKFTNNNSVANPTLNVNNTGAKKIYRYGTTAPSNNSSWSWYAGAVVSFTYDGNYWIMNDMIGNDNTYDREFFNGAMKAQTAITAGFLTCGDANGYKNVAKGATFDITYPVMYQGTAVAANATRTDFYLSIPFNFTTTNGGTSPAFTLYEAVYLYGTLSGTTFTIDSSTMWTQTVPTSANSKAYYLVGYAYSATNIRLVHPHPVYEYKDGSFHEVTVYTNTDTHWTTHLYAGDGTAANKATTNGNTKLSVTDNSSVRNSITIKGTGATTVTSDSTGVITINSTDTNTNTDTKVTQNESTSNSSFPILLKKSANTTNETDTANYNRGLVFNPGEGSLGVEKINGVEVGTSPKFTDTNTHWTTRLHAGDGTAANKTTTNGNTKLAISDDNTVRTTLTIKGTGATTVTSDSAGVITIHSTDTNTDTNNRKSFFGTCTTAAGTAEKAVTLSDTAGWELKAGTIVGVKFTNTNTAGSAKLNVNSSGAKSIWYGNAVYTSTNAQITGQAGYITYYMYDGTNWVFLNHSANHRDTDTTHQQRLNNSTYKAAEALYRYQILFTKNETTLLPASSGNNNTANNKTMTTNTFDPFGPIYYYNSSTTVAANANIGASTLLQQVNINLYYAFNCNGTLTNQKAVYVVCVPQSDGFVKLHSTPLSQTLPTTDDGLIYIFLGLATSTGNIELNLHHPVYCFRGGHLQEYTGNIYAEDVTANTVEADLFSDLQYNNMITTVTLAPGSWSSSAPYTQTVAVSGMRATAHPFFWLADTNSAAVANAFYYIDIMTTANGSVTFKCLSSKPTVGIPVMIKGK